MMKDPTLIEALRDALAGLPPLPKLEPPSLAERLVADGAWYAGFGAGYVYGWAWMIGYNLRNGFEAGRPVGDAMPILDREGRKK